MDEDHRTNEKLREEVEALRCRVAELEAREQSISDLQRAQEKARETERRFRSLIEHTTDAVFCYECDPPLPIDLPLREQVTRLYDCILAECNDVCARAYGAKRSEEVVGRKLTDLFGTRAGSLDGLFTEMIESGYRVVDGEGVEILEDGTRRYFLNNGHGVIEDGQLLRIWGTYRDVTDRKRAELALRESEEKYRKVVANTSDAIAVIDAETRQFVEVNEACLRMHGFAREELVGMRHSDITAEPDDSERTLQELVEGEAPLRIPVRYHRKKDGTVFPVEITASLLQLGDRRCVCGIMRDITERRQLEDERQRIEKLESVGVLAGGIAHDFNNILSGILCNVSLTKRALDQSSEQRSRLEVVEGACKRAADLTQQLLTFAKGGAPVRTTEPIGKMLRQSTLFVLRGANVSASIDIPDDLWVVDADIGQLSQVMHNLVINARQAMPGGGLVRVTATNAFVPAQSGLPLPPGDYVRVTVEDRGTGIPQQDLERIFDPYFTTKGEGSGLGLAVSHSIVRKHGGCMTVESEPGRGTAFNVHLPAAGSADPRPEVEVESPRSGTGRILVMDDEPIVRDATGAMLDGLGYGVASARDGAEAVELYKAAASSGEPFDAVILDLTVPGGTGGSATAREILEFDPAARCIASSGYSNDPIMSQFGEHGFCAAIAKPYALATLSVVLQRVLGAQRAP